MHKLGDKVKIRQWSDMEKEFGLCNTDIKCRPIFTPHMRKYCGKKGTIVKITFNNHYRLDFGNGDVHFSFSDDMFEKEKTE